VLRTSAIRGDGIAAVADAIERHAALVRQGTARTDPRRRVQRLLAGMAAEQARSRLTASSDRALAALCDEVLVGKLSFEDAAEQALALLHQKPDG